MLLESLLERFYPADKQIKTLTANQNQSCCNELEHLKWQTSTRLE